MHYLGFIELGFNPLQATPTHSNSLQATPTYSNPLQATPTHSNPLQVTPGHSSPLQVTPTNSIHFNPLHAALTHCRPLHPLQTTLETQQHAIRNHLGTRLVHEKRRSNSCFTISFLASVVTKSSKIFYSFECF